MCVCFGFFPPMLWVSVLLEVSMCTIRDVIDGLVCTHVRSIWRQGKDGKPLS